MNKLLFLIVFPVIYHVVCPAKHSLMAFFGGSSGLSNFSQFVGVWQLDGTEIMHYDNYTRTAELLKDFLDKHLEHKKWFTQEYSNSQTFFRETINALKKSSIQPKGTHNFQRICGCVWDNETDDSNGMDQYRFDGEDFMQFDLRGEKWINLTSWAIVTTGNNNMVKRKNTSNYLSWKCLKWLKKYLDYERNFSQRKVPPSVSLLQKTPSSPISCHATGFYPHRAVMFWRKDGEEIHEGVDKRQILPNHDGTFQMRVFLLNLSDISLKDWKRYECVFQLSGIQDVITVLDKKAIKTNGDFYICSKSEETNNYIIGAVVLKLIDLIIAICFILFKTVSPSADCNGNLNFVYSITMFNGIVLIIFLVILGYRMSNEFGFEIPTEWIEAYPRRHGKWDV